MLFKYPRNGHRSKYSVFYIDIIISIKYSFMSIKEVCYNEFKRDLCLTHLSVLKNIFKDLCHFTVIDYGITRERESYPVENTGKTFDVFVYLFFVHSYSLTGCNDPTHTCTDYLTGYDIKLFKVMQYTQMCDTISTTTRENQCKVICFKICYHEKIIY